MAGTGFEEFFARHAGMAYGLALGVTGDPAAAEDVVQEAFMRMLKQGCDFGGADARGYLAGTVLNTARNHQRGEARRRSREASVAVDRRAAPPDAGAAASPVSDEVRAALHSALMGLEEERRIPLLLHAVESFSQREVARILRLPASTVSHRIGEGLAELRAALARGGFAALAGPALATELRAAWSQPAPPSLLAKLGTLAASGAAQAAAPAAATAKGGMLVKIGLGLTAAALAAGAGFWAAGGLAADAPAPAAAAGEAKPQLSSDWREEQWVPEDFIGVLGGGPPIGPAVEAGVGGWVCGDKAGNLYLLSGNMFNIVTPAGVVHPLAGSGRGYKDGPAGEALFDQGGDYNVARSIQCDANGNIYTAENGNHLVRRIFKDKGGKWMVDTVAGGGKKWLGPGESCAPREVRLSENIAVAAAPDGTLTIGTVWAGLLRIDADRKTIRNLGPWPKTANEKGNPILVCADADLAGNAYFIWRGPPTDGVVRVAPDGKIEHIAGLSVDKMKAEKGKKPHHIGDGAPLSAYFDTPTSIAANPDGSCVYSCGGDEYDIRRIPTDLKTTTATLVCNGRWHVMPVHPNRNRGKPDFDSNLAGKSGVEGGPLRNLMNCHINGRDYEGNLYGSLYSWVGATQNVAGKGQLRTAIYRLRRVK